MAMTVASRFDLRLRAGHHFAVLDPLNVARRTDNPCGYRVLRLARQPVALQDGLASRKRCSPGCTNIVLISRVAAHALLRTPSSGSRNAHIQILAGQKE